MYELSIRDGQLPDCLVIARLVNEFSGGAADYLFAHENNSGATAEGVVTKLMASWLVKFITLTLTSGCRGCG